MRIAYQQADGTVAFVIAAPKEALVNLIGQADEDGQLTLSDEDYRAHVYQRAVPADATNVHELPDDWTPPDVDRAYRNAWVTDGKQVTIDMSRARSIQMERIRRARDAALSSLDIETIKAVGKGDTAARDAVEAQKQVLRDIPQTIDLTSAATPQDLKAVWPIALATPAAATAFKDD